jgi:hypothetical protein
MIVQEMKQDVYMDIGLKNKYGYTLDFCTKVSYTYIGENKMKKLNILKLLREGKEEKAKSLLREKYPTLSNMQIEVLMAFEKEKK